MDSIKTDWLFLIKFNKFLYLTWNIDVFLNIDIYRNDLFTSIRNIHLVQTLIPFVAFFPITFMINIVGL